MKEILSFSNGEFEKIIREELKIFNGPISVSDALTIKSLNFSEYEFSSGDFETLYLFENLEELVFEKSNGFIDFNIFTPLKKLKYLIVGGTLFSNVGFKNIGALKSLDTLEYLSIGDFGDIDLAEICEIKQLKDVCIGWGNSVINIEAINELINLRSLQLYDIHIKSMSFLKEISCEVSLELGGLTIEENFEIGLLKRFKKCEWEMLSVGGKYI